MKVINKQEDLLILKFEAHCHLFWDKNDGFSICGIPRAEQSHHGPGGTEDICHCGLKRCPKCKIY